MSLSESSWGAASLEDWSREFQSVYGAKDNHRRLELMWAMAAEDASKVGEGVRENDAEKTLRGLAHTICWTLSFVRRLTEGPCPPKFRLRDAAIPVANISDVLWFKYPGICPRCTEASCHCPTLREVPKKEDRERTVARFRAMSSRPSSIQEWQLHFDRIYEMAHRGMSLSDIGFHLLEEVGEVFRAIRRISEASDTDDLLLLQVNLVEELADVISWSLSLSSKMQTIALRLENFGQRPTFVSEAMSISAIMWRFYKSRDGSQVLCPCCEARPCDIGCTGDSQV